MTDTVRQSVWLYNHDDADPATLVDCAVAAEAAGWDGVFLSDSLPFAAYPDPMVTLAGIAAKTSSITLGTWVTPVPRWDPWQLAQSVATLDRLADGRVLLGVGLGNEDDYEAYGVEYDPATLAERYDEALEIVDRLWSDESVDYDGEHFQLRDANVEPTPVQEPRVPILAGAWWPNRAPIRRGARWDGVMPFGVSLTGGEQGPHGEEATGSPAEELREAVAYYHDVVEEPGEIVVPEIPSLGSDAMVELCEEIGATWLLRTDLGESDEAMCAAIERGPA